jgi:hypothetical protein
MLKRTAIWKNTLGPELDDGFQTERDKLRIALLSLRDNVHFLVGRIAVALPELTQHDITHLDTLWEIASLIIGEDFELTPLEGFVSLNHFLNGVFCHIFAHIIVDAPAG